MCSFIQRKIPSTNKADICSIIDENAYPYMYALLPPFAVKNLDPTSIRRLGQTGKACFDAIVGKAIETGSCLRRRQHPE